MAHILGSSAKSTTGQVGLYNTTNNIKWRRPLDYVSDYQLKSACKDVICIAPSKVTQMIFAVLEDWYHHTVLTHSCKLVSFFLHMYLLFNCQKSGNEPDACKKRYSRIRIFTLYLFWDRAVYLRSGTENWMCLLLLLLLLRYCSLYLKIRVDCGKLRLTSSNCQTLNPHLCQMQGSWWYLLYKPRYSPFCLKFFFYSNWVGQSKIQLAASDGPFPKTPPQIQKNLADISYTNQVITNFYQEFRCHVELKNQKKCSKFRTWGVYIYLYGEQKPLGGLSPNFVWWQVSTT